MQRKPKIDIMSIKNRCVQFTSKGALQLPAPRNKLVEEIYGNKNLSALLAMTMDRLEDRYNFSEYNRIKGCEEFIEYSAVRDSRAAGEEVSYQLRRFSEEIVALMKEIDA